jgi:transaldolase
MEVFYDGLNVPKWAKDDRVTGFTTNCTIFSSSPVKSYREFYETHRETFAGKPVSFQVWDTQAFEQVDQIYSIGPNVFVKIPVSPDSDAIISYAVSKGVPLNLTAIYTKDQIHKAYELLKDSDAPSIVSVFAGSISDIFADPDEYINLAINLFKDKPNCRILWAGCREIYTLHRAQNLKCHIVTIPDGVIEKLNIGHKSLQQLADERITKFKTDAVTSGLTIL